jgi:hypothetical protein
MRQRKPVLARMGCIYAETKFRIRLLDLRQERHKPMHGKRGRHEDTEFFVISRAPLYFVQAKLYRLHRCSHSLS